MTMIEAAACEDKSKSVNTYALQHIYSVTSEFEMFVFWFNNLTILITIRRLHLQFIKLSFLF